MRSRRGESCMRAINRRGDVRFFFRYAVSVNAAPVSVLFASWRQSLSVLRANVTFNLSHFVAAFRSSEHRGPTPATARPARLEYLTWFADHFSGCSSL